MPDGEGFDQTYPENFPFVRDHFYNIPAESRKYEALFNRDGSGFIHLSTKRLQGRKLFVWGKTSGGANWQRKLLGPGVQDYLELQAGLAKTQQECLPMPPRTAWEWLEAYGGIQAEPADVFGSWEHAVRSVTALADELLPEPEMDNMLLRTRPLALRRGTLRMHGNGAAALADEVAALIDAIYVQERTEETDAQCEAAKAAWDALTDAQKALVEGEEASPDYFGLDTGDASKDDPRNQDEIGEKELLVVSFGTSFNDSRVADIKSIEDALQEANPDWSVRRAFTAQIIINHIQARDGEKIDNMEQALERAVANGVKQLVVQPTHLMHGAEYDEMCAAIDKVRDKFESVEIAEPMLGEVGSDATVINADKEAVAKAVVAAALSESGYESTAAAKEAGVAYVLMGHGTAHVAKVTYSQMAAQMDKLGYENVFIGTVEGEPEDTSCEAVIAAVKEAGYTTVVLRPLMVVAGDHANNDMAGADEDSWKTMFEAAGFTVNCQISGLGRIADVQALYVAHTKAAIDAIA